MLEADSPLRTVTRKEVLAVLGISDGMLAHLFKEGVFPNEAKTGVRNRYDLPMLVQAFVKYHAEGQSRSDMAEEKRLLVIAQRKRLELEEKERTGGLVPRDDAQKAFNETMVLVATQLDGLPGRVAGELAGITEPAEVRALLLDETRRIRDAAAAKLRDWATGTRRRRPARSSAAADS